MAKKELTREGFIAFISINSYFPLVMLLAAIIVIVAGAVACDRNGCKGDGVVFALIAGVLLFLFTLFYMVLTFNEQLGDNLDMFSCFLLFVAWAGVAGFCTFVNPFNVANNGFFASWLGFIASLGNLVFNVKWADSMKKRFLDQGYPLCLIIVGSIIVIIAAVASACCDGNDFVAIVAGGVSLVVVIIRILVGVNSNWYFALFLTIWWVILGIFITFSEFLLVGNGYIATWVCVGGSIWLLTVA